MTPPKSALGLLVLLLCGCEAQMQVESKPVTVTTGPQPICMMPVVDAKGIRGYEVKRGFRYVMVMLSEAEYEEFSMRFRGDSAGLVFKANETGKVTKAEFGEKGKRP